LPVESHVAVGTTIAEYLVEEPIGSGGMGEVYRARDERLGRRVALKVLLRRLADDPGFRERLLRESRLAASLDHPNVVPVYEAGEADGRLFISMRYVDGTDLKALLRRQGVLDPARAIALAAQVAAALDAAHALGLVHRDVKPSNVLIDQQGGREHVYLADFGLTQSASDREPADGSLMGSVDYVAPEQIRGEEVDGRADVYALGCLLFEALTGSVPFTGVSEVAIVYAHLDEEPPSASERLPGLPPAVDCVLRRAMAKEREVRQPTATGFVEEATAALGLVPAAKAPRRWPLALAGCLALVAIVVAVGAVVLARSDGGPAALKGGTIVSIDPVGDRVATTYKVSAHPSSVTTSRSRVWVGSLRDGSLWRIDPATGEVERFTTAGEPRDLAASGDELYVASDGQTPFEGIVARYNAITGAREDGVDVLSCSVAARRGVLWVAGCPFLVRVSAGSQPMKIERSVFVPFQEPRSGETSRSAMRDMAIGEGALWVVGDVADRRVFKVDLRTGRILHATQLPFAPRSIAVGEGGVWVTGAIDDVLARLDPGTGQVVRTIHVPRGAAGVAVGGGSVWIASTLDGSVSRIDPRSLDIVKTIPVAGAPSEVTYGLGRVWVTANES
jgi:streptogramin lyase/predicted Ser/Thr protein kinase